MRNRATPRREMIIKAAIRGVYVPFATVEHDSKEGGEQTAILPQTLELFNIRATKIRLCIPIFHVLLGIDLRSAKLDNKQTRVCTPTFHVLVGIDLRSPIFKNDTKNAGCHYSMSNSRTHVVGIPTCTSHISLCTSVWVLRWRATRWACNRLNS